MPRTPLANDRVGAGEKEGTSQNAGPTFGDPSEGLVPRTKSGPQDWPVAELQKPLGGGLAPLSILHPDTCDPGTALAASA